MSRRKKRGISVENSRFQSTKQLLLIQVLLMLLSKIPETPNQLWDPFMSGEIPLIVVELCGWDVQSLDDKRLRAPA